MSSKENQSRHETLHRRSAHECETRARETSRERLTKEVHQLSIKEEIPEASLVGMAFQQDRATHQLSWEEETLEAR